MGEGWGAEPTLCRLLAVFDIVQEFAIIISSQGNNASDKQEIHIMPKKIITVEAPKSVKTEAAIPKTFITDIITAEFLAYAFVLDTACADDIATGKKSDQSGADVASAFDHLMSFDWTLFKGNGSKKTCLVNLGMLPADFTLVKTFRDNYKAGWDAAKLPNFDRRWQYVVSKSVHSASVEGEEGEEGEGASEKTDLDKCIKALENALRYATAEEFTGDIGTADAIREAQKLNGIVEAD